MTTLATDRDGPRSRWFGARRIAFVAGLAALLGVYVVGPARAQDASPGATGAYEFLLVAVSQPEGAADDPTLTERVGVGGYGTVTVEADPTAGPVTEGTVAGGGTFNHWDSAEDLPVPKPIVAQGTWTADKLVSFEVIGTFGTVVAGTLVMDVTLYPDGADPVPAQLTIVCNSPPGAGGLATGLLEGFYATVGEMKWEPFGVGLTTFVAPGVLPQSG